jgi:hypothetical protein
MDRYASFELLCSAKAILRALFRKSDFVLQMKAAVFDIDPFTHPG